MADRILLDAASDGRIEDDIAVFKGIIGNGHIGSRNYHASQIRAVGEGFASDGPDLLTENHFVDEQASAGLVLQMRQLRGKGKLPQRTGYSSFVLLRRSMEEMLLPLKFR